jgi:hypothetical protein
MIDPVIFHEARQRALDSGKDLFVIRDPDAHRGDPMAWICYWISDNQGTKDMPVVARRSRYAAEVAGREWIRRRKNPIRCCGAEISPIYEAVCKRCGEDYRM